MEDFAQPVNAPTPERAVRLEGDKVKAIREGGQLDGMGREACERTTVPGPWQLAERTCLRVPGPAIVTVRFVFAEEIGPVAPEFGHDLPWPVASIRSGNDAEQFAQEFHLDPLVL